MGSDNLDHARAVSGQLTSRDIALLLQVDNADLNIRTVHEGQC